MNKNKSIKSKRLKKYDPGKVAGAITSDNDTMQKYMQQQQLMSQIGGGLQFATGILSNFSKPSFTTTQNTYQTGGPISYQRTDAVNSQQEMSNLNNQNTANTINSTAQGASAGMSIGGPIGAAVGGITGLAGGLIGGIFRKNKMKRMISTQNQRTQNTNNMNLGQSDSQYLQNQYANKYGSQSDDNLYNNGKNANSLVGHGETIVNGNTGNLQEVTGGTNVGVDNVPANIQPQDAIAGNKVNPATGKTFAEDMKPLSRMEKKLSRNSDRNNAIIAQNTADMVKRYTQPAAQEILAQQEQVLNKNPKAKYDKGKFSDYLSTGLNTVAGLSPTIYNFLMGQQTPTNVNASQLYSGNPYESQVLNTLANRRYNANPELENATQQERIGRYNERALGNEAGINRAMDVENNIQTQRTNADILSRKQAQDNSYMTDWANTAAQLGAQSANQKTAAMQTAYDLNQRSLAAKNAYTTAGVEGLSNYMQNAQKTANENSMNDFQMDLMQKMYNLYYKQQANGQSGNNAMLGLLGSPSITKQTAIPVSMSSPMPQWSDVINNKISLPYNQYQNAPISYKANNAAKSATVMNPLLAPSYTNIYGNLPYLNYK